MARRKQDLCSASPFPHRKGQENVKSKIWISQVSETSNWGIQNVCSGVKSSFLSGCTQCHKAQDSPGLSWGWWAASRFALMTVPRVPGLHGDIPCLTGGTWPPLAAELSLNSFLPHYSQYRNSNSKDTSSHVISQTQAWCYKSWCPASPAHTLPLLNAPTTLLWELL